MQLLILLQQYKVGFVLDYANGFLYWVICNQRITI